ncbi:YlxR family protein [Polymorphospora rubra]|uniref:YlxR family protein n=1 Tax=Polymorphospora rubra TaxID=338584 RepID=UPI0033C91B11
MGCRRRAPAAELLRIIAIENGAGHSLSPDPGRNRPGRGAHLHLDPACFTLAQRRRAFGRALRITTGAPDTGELAEYLRASTTTSGHPTGRGSQAR